MDFSPLSAAMKTIRKNISAIIAFVLANFIRYITILMLLLDVLVYNCHNVKSSYDLLPGKLSTKINVSVTVTE